MPRDRCGSGGNHGDILAGTVARPDVTEKPGLTPTKQVSAGGARPKSPRPVAAPVGLFRFLLAAIGLLVLVLVVVGAVLYASDYAVEANVKDKQCRSALGGNFVVIQTKALAIDYTVTDIPDYQCGLVNAGNYVKYHLRSERTSIYASEGGTCIYDSVGGIGGCP